MLKVYFYSFRPSAHKSFHSSEPYLKEKYETAEELGKSGGDCDLIYSECDATLLDQLTYTRE